MSCINRFHGKKKENSFTGVFSARFVRGKIRFRNGIPCGKNINLKDYEGGSLYWQINITTN